MDLKSKIEACISAGFHDTDVNLLAEIYKEVFLEPLCTTCTKDIYNARIRLRKYCLTSEIEVPIMKAAKYQFKKEFVGQVVNIRMASGSIARITAESLTDALAVVMLKDDNAKDFIEEVKAKEEKPTKG